MILNGPTVVFMFSGSSQDIIDDHQSAGEPVTLGHRGGGKAEDEDAI